MIEAVMVGLLVAITVALYDISRELKLFRKHFDGQILNDYDRRNLIDTIGRMHDALAEIRINTGHR